MKLIKNDDWFGMTGSLGEVQNERFEMKRVQNDFGIKGGSE